jgi:hypothetical protein
VFWAETPIISEPRQATGRTTLRRNHLTAGLVDLLRRPGDRKTKHFGGIVQTLGMFGQLEYAAVIDALALEYRRGVMQGVTQDMYIGIFPVDQFTIEPD